MRCNDCGKFRTGEFGDEEMQDVDLTGDGATAEVHVYANCEECGGQMAYAAVDLRCEDADAAKTAAEWLEAHSGDDHQVDVELEDLSVDEDWVPAGPRSKKMKRAVRAEGKVAAECHCVKEAARIEIPVAGFAEMGDFEEM